MGKEKIFVGLCALLSAVCTGAGVSAQSLFDETFSAGETLNIANASQDAAQAGASLWSLTDEDGAPLLNPEDFGPQVIDIDSLPPYDLPMFEGIDFLPQIYGNFLISTATDNLDPFAAGAPQYADMNWADKVTQRNRLRQAFLQDFWVKHPDLVPYNVATLPEPPKIYVVDVDPQQAKITVKEFVRDASEMASTAGTVDLKRINWLHDFDASLQFSQAYVSPNWYQGGNSNLNAILSLLYDVKLNPKFHPNLIFETSFQYKLAVNNAPEDSVHSYNISQDLLQINSKFGYKAAKHWYYSVTGQFKTQVLNNYKTNSTKLTAAFLSPADLTVGVGMTYHLTNKRVDFTAAISPVSYNLKVCTDKRLNPASFGIEEGHTTVSNYGSSSELTFKWNIAHNIEYFSRLFLFSNYQYLTGDWENTLTFNINRFLTTKIFAHLRYQSDALPMPDVKWQYWQLKEILSIGFSYKFNRS